MNTYTMLLTKSYNPEVSVETTTPPIWYASPNDWGIVQSSQTLSRTADFSLGSQDVDLVTKQDSSLGPMDEICK